MALAARPSRSFSRARLILWLACISIAVVVVNGIVSGARKGPTRQAATLSFVDTLRPLINDSNSELAELNQIRTGFARTEGATSPADNAKGLQKRLLTLVNDVNVTKDKALAIEPPKSVRESASLAWSSFALRAQATDAIGESLKAALNGDDGLAKQNLADVNSQLAASDSIYLQFKKSLQRQNIKADLPDSVWLPDASAWQADDAKFLIATWKSNLSTAVIHNVAVVSVDTDPSPVRSGDGNESGLRIIPSQKNMTVTVVVANIGNATETNVAVKATILASDGTSDAKNDSVTLKPGARSTLIFHNIRVVPDGTSSLVVQAGPVANDTDTSDNTITIAFTMNPTAGTTTTTVSATTIVAKH